MGNGRRAACASGDVGNHLTAVVVSGVTAASISLGSSAGPESQSPSQTVCVDMERMSRTVMVNGIARTAPTGPSTQVQRRNETNWIDTGMLSRLLAINGRMTWSPTWLTIVTPTAITMAAVAPLVTKARSTGGIQARVSPMVGM